MIPVFEPALGEEEAAAVAAAVRSGEISGTYGATIEKFEDEFANAHGVRYGVATTSGTTALHLALAAAGISAGDEVLIPASTNIATALAVVYCGALPVPVDSDPHTWNLDLDQIEASITPRTAAIIPVHLYGNPVAMDRLCAIAQRHRLLVIEDAAEAHGARYQGRPVGSFGDSACFSFYANKLVTTGEGGMVITNNQALAATMRRLRNLAFTKPRFRHEEIGFNYRMTGYQAAMGRVQLQKLPATIRAKQQLAASYQAELQNVPGLRFQQTTPGAERVWWMYALALTGDAPRTRDQLCQQLHRAGIDTRTAFCPMNLQPALQQLPGWRPASCPVAQALWEQGFYLPSSTNLTDAAIERISRTTRALLVSSPVRPASHAPA